MADFTIHLYVTTRTESFGMAIRAYRRLHWSDGIFTLKLRLFNIQPLYKFLPRNLPSL